MSSILEALKKLDRERTERKEGVVNIEREILKSQFPGAGKRRYFSMILALAGSVALLLLFLVFFWWRPFPTVETSRDTTAVRQKVPAPDSSKTGRLPMPTPTSQSSVADKKVVAPAPLQRKAVPRSFQPEKESRPAPPLPAPGPKVPAAIPVRPAPAVQSAAPGPTPRKQPETTTQPLPMLSVAGIAFRGDRGSRLAIINGQPVGIGETIEGAKVEDILEDKIRLSYQGRKFFLRVGESTRNR